MIRVGLVVVASMLLLSGCASGPTETSRVPIESKADLPSGEVVPFRDAAEELGLVFRQEPALSGEFHLPEIMGSGVALFDFDRDGDLDVFLVQARGGSKLFRNELIGQGKFRFTDVSAAAGIVQSGYGMGVAAGDFDNDGFVDLYLTSFGSNNLLHNNSNGTFSDVTRQAGVDDPRWSSSAMFFDYDRDGLLDLFVVNYVNFTAANHKACISELREKDYCSPKAYRPVPDRLFRNVGKGRFEDVTAKTGITAAYGPGLGVAALDVNGDGFLDVYVANDGAPNLLWLNHCGQRFEEVGLMSATAVNANGQSEAGMGIAAGDFDNDGDEDLLVTNLAKETVTLYSNDGKGMFEDRTDRHRLGQTTFASTGFGTGWIDFDNDGFLDLFTANGAVTIAEERRGNDKYPYQQRNQLFRNTGRSGQFVEIRGGELDALAVGRGAAFGDLDLDGDVDIVVSNNHGMAKVLLNEQRRGNHWLTVRLRGIGGNRDGLGSRVGVRLKDGSMLWRWARTDGSYLSASSSDVHFGLGPVASPVDVEVEWLGGGRQTFQEIQTDRMVVLEQKK